MNQILPRPEIPLGGLDGSVAQQQLDLLKFAAGRAAELGTGTPQVVRRNAGNANLSRVTPEHLPHDLLAEALASNCAATIHRTEYVPAGNTGSRRPRINRHLHPRRHRRSADTAVLSNEIDNAPTTVALLDV